MILFLKNIFGQNIQKASKGNTLHWLLGFVFIIIKLS